MQTRDYLKQQVAQVSFVVMGVRSSRNNVSCVLLPFVAVVITLFASKSTAFHFQTSSRSCRLNHQKLRFKSSRPNITYLRSSLVSSSVGPRISINEQYPGLEQLYSNPDIFVVENFLDDDACHDLIEAAKVKKLEPSPVAYAGWTQDFKDLVELSAKGPVAWVALATAWFQVKDSSDASQLNLVVHSLQNYAIIFVLVTALIAAFTFSRAEGLKSLRTSTSTTLDDLSGASSGTRIFVENAAKLFRGDSASSEEASMFEAPTVIRYEADQVLAPHFDANRSAQTEDANRGGQTLATLLVYLNDVEKGGLTRFGRLPASISDLDEKHLTVQPKKGSALLFFPADAKGQFDERTEHEGCPAIDEKWIARIWRHENRVPPPFGLSEDALKML